MTIETAVVTKRYLYVLNGYVGQDLGAAPGEPTFEYQRFVQVNGADVVSLSTLGPDDKGAKPNRKWALLAHRFKLAMLVARRADRYDAIIASGEDIGILVALALRVRRRRTPLVMVTHGPQFGSAKFRLVLAAVKSMPNVIFACLSRSLADRLALHHGIDPRRCLATGYGIDTEYFRTDPAPTEAMVASAGASNRDYDTLVLAVAGTGIDTRIASHSTWVGAANAMRVVKPDHVEFRSYGNYANLRESTRSLPARARRGRTDARRTFRSWIRGDRGGDGDGHAGHRVGGARTVRFCNPGRNGAARAARRCECVADSGRITHHRPRPRRQDGRCCRHTDARATLARRLCRTVASGGRLALPAMRSRR